MQYPRIPWDQRSFELNPLVENVDLFKIYPNPTKEFIVVENLGVPLTDQTKVEIIDLNGRKVIEMNELFFSINYIFQ